MAERFTPVVGFVFWRAGGDQALVRAVIEALEALHPLDPLVAVVVNVSGSGEVEIQGAHCAIRPVEFDLTAGNTENWVAMAVLPNGQILVSGTVDDGGGIAKLTSDGAPVTGFGNNGQVTVKFGRFTVISSIATTADGRIVVACTETYVINSIWRSRLVAVRLLPDGGLDLGFGGTGIVAVDVPGNPNASASHVLATSDGKVLLSGSSTNGRCILVRLTNSGFLDASFAVGGVALFDFAPNQSEGILKSLIQPDGKIVSAGTAGGGGAILAFRLHGNGLIDEQFGDGGRIMMPIQGSDDFVSSLALRPSGGLILAGGTGSQNMNSFVIALTGGGTSMDLLDQEESRRSTWEVMI